MAWAFDDFACVLKSHLDLGMNFVDFKRHECHGLLIVREFEFCEIDDFWENVNFWIVREFWW